MKASTIRYAVATFERLRDELEPVIEALGFTALQAMVRQRYHDTDRGWFFTNIGFEEEVGAFWGVFHEERNGKEKEFLIVMDGESIDSIEFESFTKTES